MNEIQEFKNDRGTFKWLMEFIEIAEEHELECKSKITIDAYNKAVCVLDQLAEKYKLHDQERRKWDNWYEHRYMFPKLREFFDKKSSDYIFNKALDELWWYNDQEEPMNDFCKFIEEFAIDMKIYTKAQVISLSELGFKRNKIYIAYDNDDETMVLSSDDFVEHIKCEKETLDNNYKELWAKEIFKIVEKYE